ncbi:MAG: hypothetical protein A2W91_10230 [Bacteroidetes bacterium GWF2_38_335]|nr:MAG: hypothetical protein A2W91_10230 [Bacteroidetes bacterium GWF2_38_335]HBS87998.1 DNA-binding response regulator [Bacteroidales bacterium]
MKKINVILVDDHSLVRDGIKSLLKDSLDIEVIGEAGNGVELFNLLKNTLPDIAILDISLPGESGIELTKKIKTQYPQIDVLILSMYLQEDFVLNAVKAGARGYLPKNTSKAELLTAISEINQGNDYFSSEISRIMLKSYFHKAKAVEETKNKAELLTKREKEILKMVAEGMHNSQIAEKLFISTRTVESHKTHILQKLEINNSVDLVKFAIKNGIIDLNKSEK